MPGSATTSFADQPFLPVIVGAHVGAYSLVRAFHEGYAVRSAVLAGAGSWVTDHSQILQLVHCANPTDPEALTEALLAPRFAELGIPKLVMATSDSLVDTIVAIRDRLPADYLVPYVGAGPLDIATRKHTFALAAQAAGVDIPATVVVDCAEPGPDPSPDFAYPVIVKATAPNPWSRIDFEGKAKVHQVDSPQQLQALLDRIRAAGYRDKMVIQDRIPGDDTGMRILTCYCDKQSRVRFAAYGQTLLEEHAPGLLGVPAAILTGVDAELVAQAQRLLTELRWVGYANFDLKFDPRDGTTKFFELNPRLGRSNYYVTGTGHNAITPYVQEWVYDELPEGTDLVQTTERTVYSVVPVRTIKWALQGHPQLWREVQTVLRAGGLRNPMRYAADRPPRRWAKLWLAEQSYDRKMRQYYDPVAAAAIGIAEAP